MVLFEMLRLFSSKNKRIICIMIITFLSAIFSVKNVNLILQMSNLMPDGSTLTISDYIIGIFNSSQLIMFFVFPLLISILTGDIIISDFNDGIVNCIFIRMKNRFDYVFNKVITITIISIMFTAMLIVISFIVGFLFNIPLANGKYHFVFLASIYNNISHTAIYIITILMFILGLIFISLMTILISLYTKSSTLAIGLIVIIGFLHNVLYVIDSDILLWMPFSQYILGLHSLFAPFGIPIDFFTPQFSIIYLFLGISVLILLIYRKINKSDINDMRLEKC